MTLPATLRTQPLYSLTLLSFVLLTTSWTAGPTTTPSTSSTACQRLSERWLERRSDEAASYQPGDTLLTLKTSKTRCLSGCIRSCATDCKVQIPTRTCISTSRCCRRKRYKQRSVPCQRPLCSSRALDRTHLRARLHALAGSRIFTGSPNGNSH